jgi:hypothetical protein
MTVLLAWLVKHLLLRDFDSYEIIFINVGLLPLPW